MKHLNGKALGQKKEATDKLVAFGRMAKATDVTDIAVVVSPKAADCSVAQTCNVDGGSWMS